MERESAGPVPGGPSVLATAAAVATLLLPLAACAPPTTAAGRALAGDVYVANSFDGTITRLDGTTGRASETPLPAGHAPWQMAAGPDDRLLVLAAGGAAALTRLAPTGQDGAWVAQAVPLEAGASGAILAGDGRGGAALTYRVVASSTAPAAPAALPAPPCQLAAIDIASGAVGAPLAPCRPGETVAGLALGDGPGGPTAYLSLWRTASWDAAGPVPGGGLIRSLDLASGAVVAEARLAGLPGPLLLAAGPGAAGQRLYGVEGFHSAGEPGGDAYAEADLADRWLVRGRNPLTLSPETAVALPARPKALAIAPDGDHGFALAGSAGRAGPGDPARVSTALVHLDLRRGSAQPLGRVPGSGYGGLAVAGDRLYVPNPEGDAVAVVDRRSGAPLPPVKTGRGPAGVLLASG